ncbi:hypothetical protein B0H13DRAFT_1867490 [Mycena leptocephala]|nr:hypothetical protein B0H13DRAFT_1867490 [Mycena leptocephala]
MSEEAGPSNFPPVNNTPELMSADRLTNLEAQLVLLLAALATSQTAPDAAAPPLPAVQTPLQQNTNPPPPVLAPQFTAPIAPLNSPAGASPSLRSLFPDIELACITLVITHDLKAADLYKLDTRIKDADPTYSLSAGGTFEMNMSRHRAYKSISSILFPLHTYFTAHLPARSAATVYFT